MGTRHTIGIKSNDKLKVMQYGQWDGYPEGQGQNIQDIMKNIMNEANGLETLKNKVDNLNEYTDDDLNKMYESDSFDIDENPELNRDTSSDLIKLIYNGEVDKVYKNPDFIHDSLFCEWAYIIDLDENNIKVLRGFNGNEDIVYYKDEWNEYKKNNEDRDGYVSCGLAGVVSFDDLKSNKDFYELLKENLTDNYSD